MHKGEASVSSVFLSIVVDRSHMQVILRCCMLEQQQHVNCSSSNDNVLMWVSQCSGIDKTECKALLQSLTTVCKWLPHLPSHSRQWKKNRSKCQRRPREEMYTSVLLPLPEMVPKAGGEVPWMLLWCFLQNAVLLIQLWYRQFFSNGFYVNIPSCVAISYNYALWSFHSLFSTVNV